MVELKKNKNQIKWTEEKKKYLVDFTKKDSVILSLNKKSNIEILKKYAIDNNLPIMTRKWIKRV